MTQLGLYNSALRRLGELSLSALTDNVPQRHHLDTIWTEDPVLLMLEKYGWSFARKTVEWNYNAAYDPAFGYQYVFDQPSDYVRLVEISTDGYFSDPFRNYRVENGFWFCDFQTLYVVYVSKDTGYGYDYTKWTKLFESMVATYMAQKLSLALNKSQSDKDSLAKEMRMYETQAKSLDAMESPTRRPPQGTWTRSRTGRARGDTNRGPVLG